MHVCASASTHALVCVHDVCTHVHIHPSLCVCACIPIHTYVCVCLYVLYSLVISPIFWKRPTQSWKVMFYSKSISFDINFIYSFIFMETFERMFVQYIGLTHKISCQAGTMGQDTWRGRIGSREGKVFLR